tara:strand:+ start:48498 stop:48674 length:177 start_codon:yes stop_codon:yes gene_type:complete
MVENTHSNHFLHHLIGPNKNNFYHFQNEYKYWLSHLKATIARPSLRKAMKNNSSVDMN